jgi:predicted dienelactone hydrolase
VDSVDGDRVDWDVWREEYIGRRMRRIRSWWKRILIGCGVVGVLGAAIGIAFLIYLVSAYRRPLALLVPSGPYAVGRTAYDWVDESRSDPLADRAGEKRELPVWVWYPAEAGPGQTAGYLPPAWLKAQDANAGLGKYIESNYSSIQTHSHEGAPISGSQGAYPVIVMQPGMGPAPADYTSLAENLASHGYVVVGVNETYTSNLVVFPDGRAVPRTDKGTIPDSDSPAATDADAGRIGKVWAQDAVFMMDRLQSLNDDPSSFFHGRLDLAHLGLFGHSFGGATAAVVCKMDKRCKAGADLDGTLFSYQAAGMLQTPFLFMAEDKCGKNCDTMLANFSASQADVYYLSIDGTRHFNFSDLPLRLLPPARLLFRAAGYIGSIRPERGVEITNAYLVAFFDQYLKGEKSGLLREAGYEGVMLEWR